MSGLDTAERDTAACRGDAVGEGLAVQGEGVGTQGQQLSIRG
jgi:hypothetical protein